MAHYYAEIQGNRGEASRLGTKRSGIRAHVASWQGAVSVRLWYDADTGKDIATVSLVTHYGEGASPSILLYHGPVSGEGLPRDYADAVRAVAVARDLGKGE